MRPIKIRAWNPTDKRWLPFVGWGEAVDHFGTAHEDGTFTLHGNDELCVYSQFTGLTDKNGKEIYEGDILHMNSGTRNPYVVVWAEAFTGWGLKGNVGELVTWLVEYIGDLEVIGNIYEKPELLKSLS